MNLRREARGESARRRVAEKCPRKRERNVNDETVGPISNDRSRLIAVSAAIPA